MSGDFSRASAHPVPLSPEELRRRTFTNSFRGYDQGEVRELIESVAAELERLIRSEAALRREVEAARQAPPPPARLDEATLTAALGAEAAKILHSAHEASTDLRRKAWTCATSRPRPSAPRRSGLGPSTRTSSCST